MNERVTLVEDVICKQVWCSGNELEVWSMDKMPTILSQEEMNNYMDETIKLHKAKVHKFRGGIFGHHGVKIAFSPNVEEKLRLPLLCLEEELEHKERIISMQQEDLLRYRRASFWKRLKWAFTGSGLHQ